METKHAKAIVELMYKIADDALIMGHRNSEWTGLGPVLEEDIAFSSIAQDKVGQAWNLYQVLHNHLEQPEPDEAAFLRKDVEYKCCHLVEHPIREYDFSLTRQFFYNHAELLRYEMLSNSTYEPLAQLARKFTSEIKYHVFHANTWMTQLGNSNEEAKARMQSAIDEVFPLALGIFEESEFEKELISSGIFEGEETLKNKWLERVTEVIGKTSLALPSAEKVKPAFGGRKGYHTEHLQPLLNEMGEVLRQDEETEW